MRLLKISAIGMGKASLKLFQSLMMVVNREGNRKKQIGYPFASDGEKVRIGQGTFGSDQAS